MRLRLTGHGALAVLALILAYEPSQSTGTGTHQGASGETSTGDRAAVDSKSGKNEDSGSATGAPRESSQSGMETGESHGSKRGSTAEADRSGKTLRESGAGTTSGASKSRK